MLGNHIYENIPYLDYYWLLGAFGNSSCDIKMNVNIVQNCCRNLAARGLYGPLQYGQYYVSVLFKKKSHCPTAYQRF